MAKKKEPLQIAPVGDNSGDLTDQENEKLAMEFNKELDDIEAIRAGANDRAEAAREKLKAAGLDPHGAMNARQRVAKMNAAEKRAEKKGQPVQTTYDYTYDLMRRALGHPVQAEFVLVDPEDETSNEAETDAE